MDVHDSDAGSEEVLQERVEARTELLKVGVLANDAAARSPRLELDDPLGTGKLTRSELDGKVRFAGVGADDGPIHRDAPR